QRVHRERRELEGGRQLRQAQLDARGERLRLARRVVEQRGGRRLLAIDQARRARADHRQAREDLFTGVAIHAGGIVPRIPTKAESGGVSLDPVTREDRSLAVSLDPVTREDRSLAVSLDPVTREDRSLAVSLDPVTREDRSLDVSLD